MKKLAAIYNVWDGDELLPGSIRTIKDHIDIVIIVFQNVSNFGEEWHPLIREHNFYGGPPAWSEIRMLPSVKEIIFRLYEPDLKMGGAWNERHKRNIGIDIARQLECTHFLHVDCDEYYEDFGKLKQEYIYSGCSGSVCPIYTYFKKPTWRLEQLDGYFVPFIHAMKPDSKAGLSSYPFYVDPTRGINENDVKQLSMPMHHFSWVRKNIERKARNSSAGQHGNKLKGLLDDYNNLNIHDDPTGYIIKDMGSQRLITVPDTFGLNAIFFP